MLEEILEGGGGGSDTKNATGLHASGPLDPCVANVYTVEGSVDLGCDILGIVSVELEPCIVGELKGVIIHGHRWGGGGLLLVVLDV